MNFKIKLLKNNKLLIIYNENINNWSFIFNYSPTSTRLGSDVKVDENEDLVRPASDFEAVDVPVEPETTQATTTSMFVSMRTSRRTTGNYNFLKSIIIP